MRAAKKSRGLQLQSPPDLARIPTVRESLFVSPRDGPDHPSILHVDLLRSPPPPTSRSLPFSFSSPGWPFFPCSTLAMSASVRVRRTASPPPSLPHSAPRFPNPKHGHLDADERRAAASRGYGPRKVYPPGGVNLTSAEWKLLGFVVFIAAAVRLFRLSQPSSVV